MCLESTDEIMAITHAHLRFPSNNHFEQSIPWITDVYFGIITCPASALVFPISSHLQTPNKSLYLYWCQGWFFGIASFYSSSSGTCPECSQWKPIGRISGPLQSSKTMIAIFPSDMHPINSQLSGIPIFTSNRRFIAICFFEYIVGSNYPERGLSTSDVLVYLYPG